MAVSLTHATVAAGTDAENGEIRKAQWNEGHTLTAAEDTLLGRATAGPGAVEEITCTAAGRAILDDADAAAQRTTLGLTIGTNVQAYDAQLDDVAGMTPTKGHLIVGDGTNFVSLGVGTNDHVLTADSVEASGVKWAAAAGGGTPGGSSGQLQFNDASAFAGMAGTSWNDTTRSLTITGATVTASAPVLDLSQTWNDAAVAFIGLRLNVTNTASVLASLLLDLQVGGTTQLSVSRAGDVTSAGRAFFFTTPQTIFASDAFGFGTTKAAGIHGVYSSGQLGVAVGSKFHLGNKNNALEVESGVSIGWSASPGAGHGGGTLSGDLYLARDAAGIIAQRNGTNAQEQRTYGTFTDASNHRRVAMGMSTAGVGYLRPEGAGTGASGNVLHISGLPTSNPGPGILWNNAGTPAIGT